MQVWAEVHWHEARRQVALRVPEFVSGLLLSSLPTSKAAILVKEQPGNTETGLLFEALLQHSVAFRGASHKLHDLPCRVQIRAGQHVHWANHALGPFQRRLLADLGFEGGQPAFSEGNTYTFTKKKAAAP